MSDDADGYPAWVYVAFAVFCVVLGTTVRALTKNGEEIGRRQAAEAEARVQELGGRVGDLTVIEDKSHGVVCYQMHGGLEVLDRNRHGHRVAVPTVSCVKVTP